METKKTLSFKEAFKFACTTIIDNFTFYIKLYLLFGALYIAILGIFALIAFSVYHQPLVQPSKYLFIFPLYILSLSTPVTLLLALILGFIEEYYAAKILKSGFSAYSHEKTTILPFNTFINYFIARLWYMIKILVGLILLIAPGIYIRYKYYFTGFSVIERNDSEVENTQNNAALTENVRWQLFWLDALIIALSIFIFTSTFIFLSPLFLLAKVHLYKQLLPQKKDINPSQP